jgi:hypothetical protein
MTSNCWVEFLKYMSSKEVGTIISRQELFLALVDWPKGTVDADRVLASKKNFLKSAGWGKYEVIRKFPEYITLSEFMNIPTDNLEYLEYLVNKKENASR